MAVKFSSTPIGEVRDMVDHQGTLTTPLKNRGVITPDFHELKWHPKIPFLATGTEKEYGVNHFCLGGAEYLGNGHSISPHFVMKTGNDGRFPVLFQVGNSVVVRQHIRGELYHVNAEMIHLLDRQFELGTKCRRVKAKFFLEDQQPDNAKYFQNHPWTDALVYVAIPEYWMDVKLEVKTTHSIKDFGTKMFYEWSPLFSPPKPKQTGTNIIKLSDETPMERLIREAGALDEEHKNSTPFNFRM